MEYLIHLLIIISIYTLLSQSLNFSVGYAGLISLAQAGFFGIGAYTTAILSSQLGSSFWVNLPIAMGINAGIAFIVSLIALRTVEDYFIICTLGIQIIIYSLMNNLMVITNGPLGMPGIPTISLFGISFDNKLLFLTLCICLVSLVWFLLQNLTNSGFGKILIALNEDEIYTQSIGKNVYKSKIIAFTICATLAAIPGTLYAHYISYIDPTNFEIEESIFILSIVIIGGLKNLKGSFLAAMFLVMLPEALRFLGLADSIAANIRQIIYGLILVVIMLAGKRNFKLFSSKIKT